MVLLLEYLSFVQKAGYLSEYLMIKLFEITVIAEKKGFMLKLHV